MRYVISMISCLLAASPALAEGLSGDWGGARDTLENNGVTLEIDYIGEAVRNFDPGLITAKKTTVYHDNLDLALTLDSEQAGMWPGTTVFVHGLRNHGGDPTGNIIGDLQTASNIEAPDQFIVHEAWIEQAFMDGSFSVLAGLHDMNSEFYVSEYASLMINSSFGIGPDVSANVPVSLFPQAGLGARLHWSPVEGLNVNAAVYDGDPATRGFKAGEGEFYVVETNFSEGGQNSIKAGYWLHSANPTFGGVTFSRNYGYYGIIERELTPFEQGGIGMFLQYGHAPSDRNTVFNYVGGGFHIQGMIPGRADDEFGIAMARATIHTAPNAINVTESTLEMTYRALLWSGITVQPDMQWISNPGGTLGAPSIRVGLLRFEVDL